MPTPPTPDDIKAALTHVQDPQSGKYLVAHNMMKGITVTGGSVRLFVILDSPDNPFKAAIQKQIEDAVKGLPGITEANVVVSAKAPNAGHAHAGQGSGVAPPQRVPGIGQIIVVGSGKGGVGKSTVSVNLAVALAQTGRRVGLMDADVYGPSIPIMMGIHDKPQIVERPNPKGGDPEKRLIPLQRYGLKIMSIGFLVDPDDPVIWRGPMVNQLLRQFLNQVEWGDLDTLIVDLPPGTGDAQLTMVQAVPLAGAVVVTTPQDVALRDASKAVSMFEKVNTPIVGIIENMAYFVCDGCEKKHYIFDNGGGRREAERRGVPFLGEVPLATAVREGGDRGVPIVVAEPDSLLARVFIELAERLAASPTTTA
jgi:ATP-binding protein involved in chromosome partitioning